MKKDVLIILAGQRLGVGSAIDSAALTSKKIRSAGRVQPANVSACYVSGSNARVRGGERRDVFLHRARPLLARLTVRIGRQCRPRAKDSTCGLPWQLPLRFTAQLRMCREMR